MSDRKMPSVMWSRGKAIVAAHKVEIIAIDPDLKVIEARVYGEHAYDVIVGIRASQDSCSCPFFPTHGYCKHIAAVELYFKAQDQTIEAAVAANTNLPQHGDASQGARFVAALDLPEPQYFHGLKPATKNQLLLEATLEIHAYVAADWTKKARLFVKLRLANATDGRFFAVRDMQEFLMAYHSHERLALAGHKHVFTLSPQAFGEPERRLIGILSNTQPVEQVRLSGSASIYRRLALLNPGDFSRVVKPLQQMAHVVFVDLGNQTAYDQLTILPFAASEALFTGSVTKTDDGYRFDFHEDFDAVVISDELMIRGGNFYQATPAQFDLIQRVLEEFFVERDTLSLTFSFDERESLRQLLTYLQPIASLDTPKIMHVPKMTPRFDLGKQKQSLILTLRFDYGDEVLTPTDVVKRDAALRNLAQERQAQAYLEALGFSVDDDGWRKSFRDPDVLYTFFVAELPNLKQNGVVTLDPELQAMWQNSATLAPKVAVKAADGLLAINFSMVGVSASQIDDMLAQLDVDRPYLQRADGALVPIDDQLRRVSKALRQLRTQAKFDHGQLQVPASQALAVRSALGDEAAFDEAFEAIANDLAHPEQFEVVGQRPINADMRPYQQRGVQWLEMLNSHGFGGILADEMGLGKTLQMISFLNNHQDQTHTSLVVAPASLLYNWKAECEKFAPGLQVAVVDGTKTERKATLAQSADLWITSYNSVRNDIDLYTHVPLGYLVLDEAQFVKNGASKTHQALRKLHPINTFALSGTPIENRTDEIWAIFALVMPGLLPGLKAFKQLTPETVAIRVAPFILRRDKQSVLPDLPPRVESNLTNEMTKAQKAVYLAQLQQMQVQVRGLDAKSLVKNKLAILAGLTRLRQLCDTPALYLPDYQGGSGKLEQLMDLLQEAVANGRHVLVFSQFTGMLDQIANALDEAALTYFTLRGSTPPQKRLGMVDRFNAGEVPVFLISLKAGGTGLNLTGADLVILVDLWWNPAVEDQAIARAHRLGQAHEVDVYRLITKGTIEEQIAKLQAKKRDLVDVVMAGAQNKATLSDDDIRSILGLDPEL
ncbi:SNF2-related protein [Lacticaseibacillus porcinae]|uniref:DEAD/DEAH box helicase n=1 Tax=Lacticaseibacillus porcinae TaxID=1123687 RepID=UPI000F7A0E7D|nr:SNF2-related protein [Lacticaseibacillus porcinae]